MAEVLGSDARTVGVMATSELVRAAQTAIFNVMRSVPMGEAESWQLVRAQMVLAELALVSAAGLELPAPGPYVD